MFPSWCSQACAESDSDWSRKLPSRQTGITGRPGQLERKVSTSVRTQFGVSSVPRLMITTSSFERSNARLSVSDSGSPGGASSSLKNTLRSASRSLRARSDA